MQENEKTKQSVGLPVGLKTLKLRKRLDGLAQEHRACCLSLKGKLTKELLLIDYTDN